MQHIVITGASSGIGEALAQALGQQKDVQLTLVARRRAPMEALAKTSKAPTHIVVADLSTSDDAWLKEAAARAPIDVLINNAGAQLVGPTPALNPDDGDQSLRLNLSTPLRASIALLPQMISRGQGTIINIASMAALTPTPGMLYYNASKAGLAAASEALHHEVRPFGVHIMTVYPGIIEGTPMATEGERAYKPSALLGAQPRGTPEALAKAILRAVKRKQPRLIYPRAYGPVRWILPIAQWFVGRFAPPLALPEPQTKQDTSAKTRA